MEYVHPLTDGDEKSEQEANGEKSKGRKQKKKNNAVEPVEIFFRFLNLKAY